MTTPTKKPHGWWYALPAVVILGGTIPSCVVGISNMFSSVEKMERADMPGNALIDLDTGRQTIFYEVPGSQAHVPADLRCSVGGSGNPSLTLSPPPVTETYTVSGRSGASAFSIEVEQAGNYLVECSTATGPFTVAIGEGVSVGDIIVPIVGFTVSVFLGLGIFALIFVRRRSSVKTDWTKRHERNR